MERHTGVLTTYFYDRGFGFITRTDFNASPVYQKWYFHISKLKTGEPIVGATCTFSLLSVREGKYESAVDVEFSAPANAGSNALNIGVQHDSQ
jgi:hypothetical protein